MSYDEKTTEIEIPNHAKSSNIVRVDFAANPQAKRSASPAQPATITPMPVARTSAVQPATFDFTAPWVLRLGAVIAILLLSFLLF